MNIACPIKKDKSAILSYIVFCLRVLLNWYTSSSLVRPNGLFYLNVVLWYLQTCMVDAWAFLKQNQSSARLALLGKFLMGIKQNDRQMLGGSM